jgi:hypothetical protein
MVFLLVWLNIIDELVPLPTASVSLPDVELLSADEKLQVFNEVSEYLELIQNSVRAYEYFFCLYVILFCCDYFISF